MLYQYLLWKKASNNVRQEMDQYSFERNDDYYYFVGKMIDLRMKHYTHCIVTEYILQSPNAPKIPMVIYRIVDKYAQVDPPRGT